MSTVEVPNRNHYHSCRCLASPAFRLIPVQERVSDHRRLPHSGDLLRLVLHLDSRTKQRVRVRVEDSPLVRTQKHLRVRVGVSPLGRLNLQRIRRPQGSHLVNPLRRVGLRPPVDSRSTSPAQRRRTRRLLDSPSRHQSRFNSQRVLHSARQRLSQHARPPRAGLLLDNLRPSHQPPPLLSRLVRL